MDEQQLAAATLELLKRVDLKGAEVGAFVEINNWLQTKTQPPQKFHDPATKD